VFTVGHLVGTIVFSIFIKLVTIIRDKYLNNIRKEIHERLILSNGLRVTGQFSLPPRKTERRLHKTKLISLQK
jgi:hypothetical protein